MDAETVLWPDLRDDRREERADLLQMRVIAGHAVDAIKADALEQGIAARADRHVIHEADIGQHAGHRALFARPVWQHGKIIRRVTEHSCPRMDLAVRVGGVSCSAVTITSRKAGSQSAAFHSAG